MLGHESKLSWAAERQRKGSPLVHVQLLHNSSPALWGQSQGNTFSGLKTIQRIMNGILGLAEQKQGRKWKCHHIALQSMDCCVLNVSPSMKLEVEQRPGCKGDDQRESKYLHSMEWMNRVQLVPVEEGWLSRNVINTDTAVHKEGDSSSSSSCRTQRLQMKCGGSKQTEDDISSCERAVSCGNHHLWVGMRSWCRFGNLLAAFVEETDQGCWSVWLGRSLVTTCAGGWLFWVDLCTELVLIFLRPSVWAVGRDPARWTLTLWLGRCAALCFSGEKAERELEASSRSICALVLSLNHAAWKDRAALQGACGLGRQKLFTKLI